MSLASKRGAFLLLLAAAACGGQTLDLDGGSGNDAAPSDGGGGDSGGGDAAGGCTTNAQCGPGEACGFAESQGCAATGQCFPTGPMCNTFAPGCACSGQTINIACNGLPTGFAPAPLAHTGQCGGPMDAGMMFPCSNTACMAGQQICYIPANVGPNAGSCVPSNGCLNCQCAQMQFQCLSTCKQSGPAIYIQCQ